MRLCEYSTTRVCNNARKRVTMRVCDIALKPGCVAASMRIIAYACVAMHECARLRPCISRRLMMCATRPCALRGHARAYAPMYVRAYAHVQQRHAPPRTNASVHERQGASIRVCADARMRICAYARDGVDRYACTYACRYTVTIYARLRVTMRVHACARVTERNARMRVCVYACMRVCVYACMCVCV
jgi:hypothetical protein